MTPPEIKSKVAKVTVYTDRAMVQRRSEMQLTPDIQQIVIGNLPVNLQENTLRISGNGPAGFTILDFKVISQEFREVPEAALNTLQEEKQRFLDQIEALRDEMETIAHQKSFLQEIGVGKAKHFSKDLDIQRPLLDDWKSVLEFLGNEQSDLDAARRERSYKIRKIENDIRMIDSELKRYAGTTSKIRKSVVVDIAIKTAGDYSVDLSYLIYEASWRPMYDARVDSKAKKVGMRYYGMVMQRTGEDWQGVEVLLSTARPQIDGNAPALSPWYVAPHVEQPMRDFAPGAMAMGGSVMRSKKAMAPALEEAEYADSNISVREEAVSLSASVEAGQGSSVVFRTPGRGDISGDGGPSKLLIMDEEFENRFQYLSTPKLAEFVYLTAEVVNSTDYPLLPGQMSIFLDGNFVGNSNISQVVTPSEKFELHLGVDESIKIKRKLQKRKGDEKGLFSRSHVEAFSYLITLESYRDSEETVIVRDQLPVSTDEKIKVEVKSLVPEENPAKDKDKLANGTVEWKINLKEKAVEKLELAFELSYPKDMEVSGL